MFIFLIFNDLISGILGMSIFGDKLMYLSNKHSPHDGPYGTKPPFHGLVLAHTGIESKPIKIGTIESYRMGPPKNS